MHTAKMHVQTVSEQFKTTSVKHALKKITTAPSSLTLQLNHCYVSMLLA